MESPKVGGQEPRGPACLGIRGYGKAVPLGHGHSRRSRALREHEKGTLPCVLPAQHSATVPSLGQ